ncbi:DUF5989 family protein [Jejuia spongiicola]|uniref:DUF5989 family protein n=1 Tax=Jejuia spongiicola TaxID=2942207 RepID=A0ABT0QBR4_9FLAO|nr:DUF5989 family protein [Jejuia spongiicola]MCL6294416.1 DUF5989 family protein [Jejuia spongiicola]
MELLSFLKQRKKYWLIPIILVIVFFAALILLGENSALAPFIYSLF